MWLLLREIDCVLVRKNDVRSCCFVSVVLVLSNKHDELPEVEKG